MKFLFCIFALMAYASAASVPLPDENARVPSERIVGGKPVSIEKHPHQIALQWRKHLNAPSPNITDCGGSIYSERLIITAAHCVDRNTNASHYRVVAGSSFSNGSSGHFANIQKIIIHENYKQLSRFDNDIAILVLEEPLPLNDKTIATIPLTDKNPVEGEMATTTGWGIIFGLHFSDVLREVQVPIVSNKVCKEDNKEVYPVTDSMICAGYRGVGGKDSCGGDSGGPLVVNGKLAGVVSWGKGCALPEYPGVYANVFHLRSWLMDKINGLESAN